MSCALQTIILILILTNFTYARSLATMPAEVPTRSVYGKLLSFDLKERTIWFQRTEWNAKQMRLETENLFLKLDNTVITSSNTGAEFTDEEIAERIRNETAWVNLLISGNRVISGDTYEEDEP